MISKTNFVFLLLALVVLLSACSGIVHEYEITDATGATYTIKAYACGSKVDPDYANVNLLIVTCTVPVPEGEPAGIYTNTYSPVRSLRLVK